MPQPVRFVFYLHVPVPAYPPDTADPLCRALFRTVTYSYLPCLRMLERFAADAIPTGITLALSPSLVALLESPAFMETYGRMLDKECREDLPAPAGTPSPKTDLLLNARHAWQEQYDGRLVDAFRRLAHWDVIRLGTAPVTDAILPLFLQMPESRDMQIATALRFHRDAFASEPNVFWLPGMGWHPDLDGMLPADGGTPLVLSPRAAPVSDLVGGAPMRTPAGHAVFFADMPFWNQMFSPRGFAAAPVYENGARPPAPPGSPPVHDPLLAREAAAHHAQEAMDSLLHGHRGTGRTWTVAGALEPFGLTWREGFRFLDYLIRKIHFDTPELEPAFLPGPEDPLPPSRMTVLPDISAAPDEGLSVWMHDKSAQLYSTLHRLDLQLAEARTQDTPCPPPRRRRILRLMACEMMMMMQSYLPLWTASGRGQRPERADAFLARHGNRFLHLRRMLGEPDAPEDELRALEGSTPILPCMKEAP